MLFLKVLKTCVLATKALSEIGTFTHGDMPVQVQYDLVIKLDRQVRRKEAIEDVQSQFQEAYMSTCPKSTPEGEHE